MGWLDDATKRKEVEDKMRAAYAEWHKKQQQRGIREKIETVLSKILTATGIKLKLDEFERNNILYTTLSHKQWESFYSITSGDYHLYILTVNNTKDGIVPGEDLMTYSFNYSPDDSRDARSRGPYKIRHEEVTEDNILKWIEDLMTWRK